MPNALSNRPKKRGCFGLGEEEHLNLHRTGIIGVPSQFTIHAPESLSPWRTTVVFVRLHTIPNSIWSLPNSHYNRGNPGWQLQTPFGRQKASDFCHMLLFITCHDDYIGLLRAHFGRHQTTFLSQTVGMQSIEPRPVQRSSCQPEQCWKERNHDRDRARVNICGEKGGLMIGRRSICHERLR